MHPPALQVTTFNLYNFFDNQPTTPLQLAKLDLTVRNVLGLPGLLVLQEVGSERLLEQMAARINRAAGTGYEAAAPSTSDRRGIRVGFLWDAARLTLLALEQAQGPAVAAAFGADSPHPAREPLLARFGVGGRELRVIALHLKSNYVPPALEEAREAVLAQSLAQRRAQAAVVGDLVGAAAGWLLVAGDLNATPEEPAGPVAALEARGLVNLLPAHAGPAVYSHIHNGQPRLIDHLLATPSLAARCSAAVAHALNTGAPLEAAADPHIPAGASDHDPLSAWFMLD